MSLSSELMAPTAVGSPLMLTEYVDMQSKGVNAYVPSDLCIISDFPSVSDLPESLPFRSVSSCRIRSQNYFA